MLQKFATFEITAAFVAESAHDRRLLGKTAARADFSHIPLREGYLYVRSRAISSRINDNFDEFSPEEIAAAYRTFVGKPVFVNHHNENHRRLRGVILEAVLHEHTNPDGTPDTWVEVLMEVDALNFPMLAKAILAGEIDRTSMGTDVERSICSACGNVATDEFSYCKHIPKMKGQTIRRQNPETGQQEEVLVYESCKGLGFFENSLLVEQPADPTAYFLGVEGVGVEMSKAAKVARKTSALVAVQIPAGEVQVGDRLDSSGKTRISKTFLRNGKMLVQTQLRGARSPSMDQWPEDQTITVWREDGVVAKKRTAADEAIVAPAQVDTLEHNECPVCGQEGVAEGDRCPVCQYHRPPDEFSDPDTSKASEFDRTQDAQDPADPSAGAPVDPTDPDQAAADQSQGQPWLNKTMPADGPATPAEADQTSSAQEDRPWESRTRPRKTSKVAGREGENDMGSTPQQRQMTAKQMQGVISRQARILRTQGSELRELRGTLALVAKTAGLGKNPAIASLIKRAEEENPGQAGWATDTSTSTEAPVVTEQQAAAPTATDNPTTPGGSPLQDTSPDATADVQSPGQEVAAPEPLATVDPTKPVAGTDTLGDGPVGSPGTNENQPEPVVGTPSTDTAFPETGWTTSAAQGQANLLAGQRLARLRTQAGLVPNDTDDIVLGQHLASSMSHEAMAQEIATLEGVVKAQGAQRVAAGQERRRTATQQVQRTTPSLAQPRRTVEAATVDKSGDDPFLMD